MAVALNSAPLHAATADEGGPPEQASESLTSWIRRLPFLRDSVRHERSRADQPTGGSHGPALLPLVHPLWSDLGEEQRAALAPFEREWNAWPQSEKRIWLRVADRMPQMDPGQLARTQRRVQEWAALDPEQRRQARNNFRLAQERSAAQRAQAWQGYQSLNAEQRRELREGVIRNATAATEASAQSGLARRAAQPLPRLTAAPGAGSSRSAQPPAANATPSTPAGTPLYVPPSGERR